MNLLKKRKFETKIFFSDNVKWSSKKLLKMISSAEKTNVKQQEIKEMVAVSYKSLLEGPSKPEIQCKTDIYFSFILVGISSRLIFSVKDRVVFSLMDKVC